MPEVKLTVRLPVDLHTRLRQRAHQRDTSLNQVIIDAIRHDLEQEETMPRSERERVLQVIKESGLYEPLGPEWRKFIENAPELSYAELRQRVGELSPPLSETIIEDRGPR